jgi:hypothetical protein
MFAAGKNKRSMGAGRKGGAGEVTWCLFPRSSSMGASSPVRPQWHFPLARMPATTDAHRHRASATAGTRAILCVQGRRETSEKMVTGEG